MKTGGALSIWFFSGVCLGVNGIVDLRHRYLRVIHPPAQQLVLSTSTPTYGGAESWSFSGLIYAIRFSPARERKRCRKCLIPAFHS